MHTVITFIETDKEMFILRLTEKSIRQLIQKGEVCIKHRLESFIVNWFTVRVYGKDDNR
jgi:hypothetical protein